MIDLRSDTVTKPSKEMKTFMMDAVLGDDVFQDDPTVKELEEKTATMFGHEAGLFCSSGTMTNQIALMVYLRPGDEVICSSEAHIYNYEGGGIARNSGASARLINRNSGIVYLEEIIDNILRDIEIDEVSNIEFLYKASRIKNSEDKKFEAYLILNNAIKRLMKMNQKNLIENYNVGFMNLGLSFNFDGVSTLKSDDILNLEKLIKE